MTTRKILLISKCPENSATLGFILGMGGFRVDLVRDLDEAINWLTLRKPYGLIVINSQTLQFELIEEFGKVCKTVPVLIIDRRSGKFGKVGDELQGKLEFLTCSAENLSLAVKRILALNF